MQDSIYVLSVCNSNTAGDIIWLERKLSDKFCDNIFHTESVTNKLALLVSYTCPVRSSSIHRASIFIESANSSFDYLVCIIFQSFRVASSATFLAICLINISMRAQANF